MEYQPKSSPNLNEPVWFWIDNSNDELVPSIKWWPREIILTCWDFALRCGNCLSRNWEWRCIQSWLKSWTQVSDNDLTCDLHDFDTKKWHL